MSSQLADVSLQERAAEVFAKLGWPTTRLEEWRYTNLAPVQKIAWRKDPVAENGSAGSQPLEQFHALRAHDSSAELVFVNGRLVEQTGAAFHTPHDPNIADWERNAMVALNTANVQDGARIEIPAGTIVDGFIHLLFIGSGDDVWSHPRNVIVAGANSQVSIVETYVGTGRYFTNTVTEIVAHESAVIDHTKLECESLTAYHVGNVYIQQDRGANVTSRTLALGAALARNETHVLLGGEGASITLDGLFIGTGTQHLDNRTVVDHVHPHCESLELYKGVLDGNARGVFDGLIIVRPGAVKTVSRQTNRNLLLSETAIVDSKPNLEIHNNDVKCNHGSTIGQIDEEALFYLLSRGLDKDEARDLLVYAFASEIIDRITIEPVREQIRREMFQVMPDRLPERRGGTR